MNILPAIVIAAEIAVACWFLAFLSLAHTFEREGRAYPQSPKDPVGRVFITAVRFGFATALFVLTGMTIYALI